MTETDIQIINKEKYQDEESSEQKIIFNNIFEQIKGKELDLSIAKIFEIPTIRNISDSMAKQEAKVYCSKYMRN